MLMEAVRWGLMVSICYGHYCTEEEDEQRIDTGIDQWVAQRFIDQWHKSNDDLDDYGTVMN